MTKSIGTTSTRARRALRQAGFSMIELLVVAGILVAILVGVLGLMDLGTRIARKEGGIAEMQQAHRSAQNYVARHIRLAGRGGLPFSTPPVGLPPAFQGRSLPDGLGISVRSNVGADEYISPGDNTTPVVLENTDVLTVRGVISGTVYQVNPAPGGSGLTLTPDAVDPTAGQITVTDPSPRGVPQSLKPLADMLNAANPDRPEAILLVSPLSEIFALVELNRSTSSVDDFDEPTTITLGFNVGTPGGTNTKDLYLNLSRDGEFPDQLRSVSALGIVEEYRFYIREEFSVPGDDSTELRPRLAAARYYPGTERPYDDDAASLRIEIADNLIDLQVAVGVDTDGDGLIAEADPPDAADDWLFNSVDDDSDDTAKWNGPNPADPRDLFYLRLTTVARVPLMERNYLSDPLAVIEDRVYNEPDIPTGSAERYQRSFRRRVHQTVIDLRNL